MIAGAASRIKAIAAANRDVAPEAQGPTQDCSDVLHINFFFDGTGNNANADAAKRKWSNVAKLHQAARDDPQVGIYRFYISGVGTTFNGDTDGLTDKMIAAIEDSTTGAMAGNGGERRLGQGNTDLEKALKRALLINAEKKGGQLASVVKAKQAEGFSALNRAVGEHRLIKTINVSVFGFSRGAALARAFANRLRELCKPGAEGALTMFGYPVRFNFVGVFDTVASFGLPSANLTVFNQTRDLRIPQCVEKCVHFVAAHELRFSFPVDLIRQDSTYRAGMIEKVYPGVHSDVGGGYEPEEQGVSNVYSRIPLQHMLGHALENGCRMLSYDYLKAKSAVVAERFAVSANLYAEFCAYVESVQPKGSVEDQVNQHMAAFYSACGTLARSGSKVVGASSFQQSGLKRLMWGSIVDEAPAYERALTSGSRVVLTDDRVFFYSFEPEKWRVEAWKTPAAPASTRFFTRYVHNSKVDFVLNAEPFSYFRPRGIFEQHAKGGSSRSTIAPAIPETHAMHGASGSW